MFNTAILVLLYDKDISDSQTLNAFLSCNLLCCNSSLIIWNNGPSKLESFDVSLFENLGYRVFLEETLSNEALSIVYNRFISKYDAEKYIILDDDSRLEKNYLTESSKIGPKNIGIPIIFSSGKIIYPRVNKKTYCPDMTLNEKSKIVTIGSGLVLGKDVAKSLHDFYGDIFDERFYFYGVDTTLFLRLFDRGFAKDTILISGFEHSLSRLEKESEEISEFRRIERSYNYGLTLRYYRGVDSKIHGILKLFITTGLKKIFRKRQKIIFTHAIKAFFYGKHYRSKANK